MRGRRLASAFVGLWFLVGASPADAVAAVSAGDGNGTTKTHAATAAKSAPAHGTKAVATPTPVAAPEAPSIVDPIFNGPYHGAPTGLAWGGQVELRFAEDRQAGVSNPEWFSVGRVDGFVNAQLTRKLVLTGRGAYDRGTDDFTLERGELGYQAKPSLQLHAGIFLAPLGETNLQHDAPPYEFAERSLVATQLVGVPYAELGAGIRGLTRQGKLSYELDLVTGYDDGIITGSGGTRIPSGRNNYGDQNGIPALAGRVALHPSATSEVGLGAQSGQYNQTTVDGEKVDGARYVHLIVADGTTGLAGCRVFGEGAVALVDVPPGLGDLFASRQWGGSVEVTRTLFQPIFSGWKGSALTAGIRADAVDFDTSIQGDSRERVTASVSVRQLPLASFRLGWYYESRRDRFNNETPLAGITFTTASYF